MDNKAINDYYFQEYQALRSEKLQRYDYASRLNERLVSSTIAIWTIAFAIYAVFNGLLSGDSYNESMTMCLECLQIFLYMVPSFLSTFLFHASLNNTIRIHLISDYLRAQMIEPTSSTVNTPRTWEGMKAKERLFYFYKFNWSEYKSIDLSSQKPNKHDGIHNPETGELIGIHFAISWISMLLSGGMIVGMLFNCLPNLFSNQESCELKTYKNTVAITLTVLMALVFVLQCIIAKIKRHGIIVGLTIVKLVCCVGAVCFVIRSTCTLCDINKAFTLKSLCNDIGTAWLLKIRGLKGDAKEATLWLYLLCPNIFCINLAFIPCYSFRQRFANYIIGENSKKVSNYWKIPSSPEPHEDAPNRDSFQAQIQGCSRTKNTNAFQKQKNKTSQKTKLKRKGTRKKKSKAKKK